MVFVFWNREEVSHAEIMPRGKTINVIAYCGTLRRLREAIGKKTSERLWRAVFPEHENATQHGAYQPKRFVALFTLETSWPFSL